MELNLNLDIKKEIKKEEEKKKRVKAVEKKIKEKVIPTWEQVWVTGWTTHTGTTKKSILQSKLSELDKNRLLEVKGAVETGELGIGDICLSKFSKSYALGLYQVLKEQRRDGIIANMVENCPSNYILVDTTKALFDMLKLLNKEEVIGLDTETNGLSYDVNYIVGLSLTLPKADKHYYIPVRHNLKEGEKQLEPVVVFNELKAYLESEKLGKVLHNCKFDWHMLYREGIELKNIVMDTMVAMHVLNETEPSFALKNIATRYGKYFGFEDKSMTYEELFGKGGFENTPLDIGLVYAAKDTHLCYQLYKWIDGELSKRENLHYIYYEIENPTLMVAIEMEKNGFLLDVDFAQDYLLDLKQQLVAYKNQLDKMFNGINFDSNQQLAAFLYDDLGIKEVNGRSVDKKTLKSLAGEFEGISMLLEYRQLNKLVSTYIEPLPQKVWNRDGRLHGNFNQTATDTGRWASNNPNLQNLPPLARKMIVAPKGKIIIGSDYSQIEPRILSHISNDTELQRPYLEGTDLYSTLASKVFNLPLEECGDGSKYRKMMKTGLLAVMYGTSTHTLSQQLGISLEEAEQFIKDFYISYPLVEKFINETHAKADENGFVETMYGRKRRFIGHPQIARKYHGLMDRIKGILGREPQNIWQEKLPREIKSAYWDVAKEYGRVARQSVNAIIQGSAADVMKLGMLAVQEYLNEKGEDWKLLATVHDEILVEIPENATEEEIREIANRMIGCVTLNVPLKSDVEVMKRWGAGVSLNSFLENRNILEE